jgi:hypothetical protein
VSHGTDKIQSVIVHYYSPESTAPQHKYLKEVNPTSWTHGMPSIEVTTQPTPNTYSLNIQNFQKKKNIYSIKGTYLLLQTLELNHSLGSQAGQEILPCLKNPYYELILCPPQPNKVHEYLTEANMFQMQ